MIIKLDEYEKEVVAIAEEISFYLQKSGATRADSQDIAQDVLVKILESDIVLPFEKMRAWLYRSAVRTYIDKYRRDKRYHEILQRDFFRQDMLVLYDQENYEELYQAVNFQNMSVKEIGHILGYSQSWVKIHLFRARKQVAKLLKERGYEDDIF